MSEHNALYPGVCITVILSNHDLEKHEEYCHHKEWMNQPMIRTVASCFYWIFGIMKNIQQIVFFQSLTEFIAKSNFVSTIRWRTWIKFIRCYSILSKLDKCRIPKLWHPTALDALTNSSQSIAYIVPSISRSFIHPMKYCLGLVQSMYLELIRFCSVL